jgi:hypothetical protein
MVLCTGNVRYQILEAERTWGGGVACQMNVTSIEFLLSHIPFSDKVIQAPVNKRALGVTFYVEGKCAKSQEQERGES